MKILKKLFKSIETNSGVAPCGPISPSSLPASASCGSSNDSSRPSSMAQHKNTQTKHRELKESPINPKK
jgi:hypothetical protein